jgi:hypothetical protein
MRRLAVYHKKFFERISDRQSAIPLLHLLRQRDRKVLPVRALNTPPDLPVRNTHVDLMADLAFFPG